MINLLVADDHNVLRTALCDVLARKGDFKIVAQASDGEQVVELARSHKPDVIIMDVAMPKVNGIEAMKKLKESGFSVPVLILSANEKEMTVRAALQAGAKGFLPKHASEDELEFAIRSIVKGQTYLSPSVTSQLMTGDPSKGEIDNPLAVLTKREVEIMTHLAEGKTNRDIGKMLHISVRTVDTHRSNILKKLNLRTNAELVKLAISCGLITV